MSRSSPPGAERGLDPATLMPHRPPMLLLSRVLSVGDRAAEAEVDIDAHSSFCLPGQGVPIEIGIEYMGQTSAAIAGYQRQQGTVGEHLGFLISVNHYRAHQPWLRLGHRYRVFSEQASTVGQTLASFQCRIVDSADGELVAEGVLSVMRRFV